MHQLALSRGLACHERMTVADIERDAASISLPQLAQPARGWRANSSQRASRGYIRSMIL
jgi:hypothetical protein